VVSWVHRCGPGVGMRECHPAAAILEFILQKYRVAMPEVAQIRRFRRRKTCRASLQFS
jgi:hypothetical protein